MSFLVLCTLFLPSWYITIFVFFLQSLRARTEQTLVRTQQDESDSSRFAIKQVLSFTLTEQGAFVKDLLLQEIAKGLDALGVATLSSVTSAAASRLPFAPSPSPSLNNEEATNLRNLYRLLLLVAKTPQKENSSRAPGHESTGEKGDDGADDMSLVLNEMRSFPEFLPVLSVIPELSPESQQQFLLLPADLTNLVLSRAVARTIRRMFI
ncbi:hypothetical protein ACQJBY_012446 [Aegilops geniculata]